MADRKSRTVTFKTPIGTSLKDIKDAIIKEIGADTLTVLQQLSTGEYLVETTSATFAEELQENGFTCEYQHVACHPARGYYTNVSIMGLRAYVEDDSIIEALTPYGEIKSAVIRLKYKSDHDLAGLENGNRLVRMVLSKPSIPYSIKIGDEWCRIIHSNQQPICSECHEVGHSRRRCPQIICRNCNGYGHMAHDCVEQPAPPPRIQTTTKMKPPKTQPLKKISLNLKQPPCRKQKNHQLLPTLPALATSLNQLARHRFLRLPPPKTWISTRKKVKNERT